MVNTNEEIIKKISEQKAINPNSLFSAKREMSKKYKINSPSNVELLQVYHKLVKNKTVQKNPVLEQILRKRKIRSLSGVVVVSVLTKPYPCPGKCIYCPTEKDLPKSYVSGEPAVERAKRNKFNPYLQVKDRIKSLEIQGHPTDKIELRIIGASFSSYPKKYQEWFVKECFRAANNFFQKTKTDLGLEKEQKKNERAKHKIVGVSVETRPDLIDKKEILHLRKLGVTLVEIGVQTIYDEILKLCRRGHTVEKTIQATELLKNAGFKVMYQIMPNLPGSDLKKDFQMAKEIFSNPDFKPDWLKIYPCLVCENTKLYQIFKQNKYQTYTNKELINLLIKIKSVLPYWVRVARLFRDIPAEKIKAGSKISNIRQIIQKEMAQKNKTCRCIRCREVRERYNPEEQVYFFREDYDASHGKEIFLSCENKQRTKLYSMLRLRIQKEKGFCPAMIRELHTFGQMAVVTNSHTKNSHTGTQHKGLGKKLVKEAERISQEEFNVEKIAIISGVGVRGYYRKLGYRLKNTYMVKYLEQGR